MSVTVPASSPALCPLCRGRGCRICQQGLICPRCRGLRLLGDELRRCPGCMEGNQVNPRKERATIIRYLTHRPPTRLRRKGIA